MPRRRPTTVNPKSGAEFGLDQRLPNEIGGWRHNDFRHADLLGPVGEIGTAERHLLERELLPQLIDVVAGSGQIDQQDIVGRQFRVRRRPEHLPGKFAVAFDGHDAGARAAAQVQLREVLTHQRRLRRHAKAVFAAGQSVFLDPVGKARTAGGLLLPGRGQPPPREAHVNDTENEDRQPERREAEETKTLDAVAFELAVDDQIGRRGDERRHAANQRGHAQRHHQPAGSDAGGL